MVGCRHAIAGCRHDLHVIHRGQEWPYSSVKLMARRMKEGNMDVTLLRAQTKDHKREQEKNRETDQGSARDEHQAMLFDGAPSHRSKKTMSYLKRPDWRKVEQVSWPADSPDLNVLGWSLWGQIKGHLVRTESFAHLRTKLLRVVAELEAQGKLESASTQANFVKRLDLDIAQKGGHFEHLLKQHKLNKKREKIASTSVENDD